MFRNLLLALPFVLISISTYAHDTVVVIPIGGVVGDATQGDVLEEKTFSSREGKGLSGTMVDNSDMHIAPGATSKNIPEGYHNGLGTVEGDPDLQPMNIADGVNVHPAYGSEYDQKPRCPYFLDVFLC